MLKKIKDFIAYLIIVITMLLLMKGCLYAHEREESNRLEYTKAYLKSFE